MCIIQSMSPRLNALLCTDTKAHGSLITGAVLSVEKPRLGAADSDKVYLL